MSSTICFDGRAIARAEGETVLDALLRSGETIPHSCKSGVCQSCLMQAEDGAPGGAAQAGLKPAFVAQNYFLACRAQPAEPITVRLPGAGAAVDAAVRGKRMLSDTVAALWLEVDDDPAGYLPGQFVTLSLPDRALARSYSIANVPRADGVLEIHVGRVPQGRMSGWLHAAEAGARLTLRGPAGACTYAPDTAGADFPMLLAGTGTGLAPLMGVLRDALDQGHAGPITLVHGGVRMGDLYALETLRALAAERATLTCRFSVLDDAAGDDVSALPIQDCVTAALEASDRTAMRAYFCGAPDIVAALKKRAFMAGTPSRFIFSDPFLPSRD